MYLFIDKQSEFISWLLSFPTGVVNLLCMDADRFLDRVLIYASGGSGGRMGYESFFRHNRCSSFAKLTPGGNLNRGFSSYAIIVGRAVFVTAIDNTPKVYYSTCWVKMVIKE